MWRLTFTEEWECTLQDSDYLLQVFEVLGQTILEGLDKLSLVVTFDQRVIVLVDCRHFLLIFSIL